MAGGQCSALRSRLRPSDVLLVRVMAGRVRIPATSRTLGRCRLILPSRPRASAKPSPMGRVPAVAQQRRSADARNTATTKDCGRRRRPTGWISWSAICHTSAAIAEEVGALEP